MNTLKAREQQILEYMRKEIKKKPAYSKRSMHLAQHKIDIDSAQGSRSFRKAGIHTQGPK
jgi:hypothetical protein